jgi:hypothetical protein
MRRHDRLTRLLPVAVLLAGVLIPVLVRSGGDAPPPETVERRLRGKTAREWVALAERASAEGAHARALACIKTAEKVEPGTQYAERLAGIRRARWRSRTIAAERTRLRGGEIDAVEYGAGGNVESAWRLAVVLPGESLWSLARSAVAADRGVMPADVPDADPDVHRTWDVLTDLNGVRELEVGELIRVPLIDAERAAIEAANRSDLARIDQAGRALAAGDLEVARELRAEVAGVYASGTAACADLDAALAAAVRAERARELDAAARAEAAEHRFSRADSLALAAVEMGADPSLLHGVDLLRDAREEALVVEAYDLIVAAEELPRATRYAEFRDSLERSHSLLTEAEGLSDGVQYGRASMLVAGMLEDAEKVRVAGDGTVVAAKPAGVDYTEAARAAVEWLLGRTLATSGKQFPHHAEKTADELAWARYLADASEMARRGGADFASLLTSSESELELTLPNPDGYFTE